MSSTIYMPNFRSIGQSKQKLYRAGACPQSYQFICKKPCLFRVKEKQILLGPLYTNTFASIHRFSTVFNLFSLETVFKSYRFQSFSCRRKVKTLRKVCGLDENVRYYLLTNWLAYLYGRIQSPRPDVMPDRREGITRAAGFVFACIDTQAS